MPYYQPQYNGAKSTYELPAFVSLEKDILQYQQQEISGNDWCINANENTGTYWYRVEVKINNQIYSSLGKSASVSDKQEYERKYSQYKINFNKYNYYWDTLLEPDAVENFGITTKVSRISRKSDYAETICKDNGYNPSDKRCQFISIIEAFKNVPFAYGCSYYGCDTEPLPLETSIACPTELKHLTQNFIAVDCLDLMIGALSKTTPKQYQFNDFDSFIDSYATLQLNIEKKELDFILRSNLLFKKNNQVEIGDILFMWKIENGKQYYTHTFIVYDNVGDTRIFDEKDIVVYASHICPGSKPEDKSSVKLYDGTLCYAPIGRYLDDPNIKFTLIKVNDLT